MWLKTIEALKETLSMKGLVAVAGIYYSAQITLSQPECSMYGLITICVICITLFVARNLEHKQRSQN